MVRKLFVCDQRPWHRQFVDLPIKWKSEDLFSLLHMNQYLVEQGNFAFYIWLRKITKLFVKKEKQSQLSNYHHWIWHDGSHLTQVAVSKHVEFVLLSLDFDTVWTQCSTNYY